jgi:DNA-binding NarL/FixJ family response regulator
MPLDGSPSLLIATRHFESLAHQGVVASLAPHPHLEVVPDAGDADLLLWDLDGVALSRPHEGESALVVVTRDPMRGAEALFFGARAVIHRDRLHKSLAPAIESVLAGLCVVDPFVLSQMKHVEPQRRELLYADLTPREEQVLALLVEGLSNREIAEQLSLSPHTVKFHLASLMDKLDATSRTEAVIRAIRLGLVVV